MRLGEKRASRGVLMHTQSRSVEGGALGRLGKESPCRGWLRWVGSLCQEVVHVRGDVARGFWWRLDASKVRRLCSPRARRNGARAPDRSESSASSSSAHATCDGPQPGCHPRWQDRTGTSPSTVTSASRSTRMVQTGFFCCGRPCESKMLNPFGFSVAARVYHEAHEQIVSPNEN